MIWLMTAIAGLAMGLLIREMYDHALAVKRLWQHIDLLEGDKRALTESLTRAQGRPYIHSRNEVLRESEGWYDAIDQVVPAKKGDEN